MITIAVVSVVSVFTTASSVLWVIVYIAAAEQEPAGKSVDPAHLKSYHCSVCDQTLQLTAIDILKHKRKHAKQSVNK